DLCLPGYAELSRSIKVGEKTVPADARTRALMEASEQRVPQRAAELDLSTRAHFSTAPVEDAVDIVLEVIACEEDAETCENELHFAQEDARKLFVADGYSALELSVKDVREHPRAQKGWIVRLNGELREPRPLKNPSISGVAMFQGEDGEAFPAYIRENFELADEDHPAEAQELPEWADEGALIARGGASGDEADTNDLVADADN